MYFRHTCNKYLRKHILYFYMVEYDSKVENKCIFCEITKGNMPPLGNGLFWEDEKHMAWLSPFPNTEGFAVVVTKEHQPSDVLALPNERLNEFVLAAKKVAKVLENHYPDVGRVGLLMEGMGINHAHIKLFPMHGTEYLRKGEWKQIHSEFNTYFEKYPGFIASNDGPKADFDTIEAEAKKLRE